MGGGPSPLPVDLLILGRGWTADFLISHIQSSKSDLSHAATTRDGRDGTIPFEFDPDDESDERYAVLPDASVVLITFPLRGTEQPGRIVRGYERTRPSSPSPPSKRTKWIFLGATSTWTLPGPTTPDSPWDRSNARAVAEQALLELKGVDAVVPCLAGLYGGSRQPRNFARRVAKDRDAVRERGSVHFIHGSDLARGLLVLIERGVDSGAKAKDGEDRGEREEGNGKKEGEGWKNLGGKRWIVTDLRCYDWWELLSAFDGFVNDGVEEGERLEYAKWVGELMVEEGVAVLPREPGLLGRVLDGRGWWEELGVWPVVGRLS